MNTSVYGFDKIFQPYTYHLLGDFHYEAKERHGYCFGSYIERISRKALCYFRGDRCL